MSTFDFGQRIFYGDLRTETVPKSIVKDIGQQYSCIRQIIHDVDSSSIMITFCLSEGEAGGSPEGDRTTILKFGDPGYDKFWANNLDKTWFDAAIAAGQDDGHVPPPEDSITEDELRSQQEQKDDTSGGGGG